MLLVYSKWLSDIIAGTEMPKIDIGSVDERFEVQKIAKGACKMFNPLLEMMLIK